MMKILTTIALLGAITALSACEPEKTEYITGTVVKKAGTVVDRQKSIETSTGALFGNSSLKVSSFPTLAIQIKTDDGKIYTLAIDETPSFNISRVTQLEALNLAIDEGKTRIKIRKSTFRENFNGAIATLRVQDLEILQEE